MGEVGVTFTHDDVTPYEIMKLSLLNAYIPYWDLPTMEGFRRDR